MQTYFDDFFLFFSPFNLSSVYLLKKRIRTNDTSTVIVTVAFKNFGDITSSREE